MHMGKLFKLQLSNVIPSFHFCRSKHHQPSLPSIYKPSPVNRKVFDINYPNLPAPPPSTPEESFYKHRNRVHEETEAVVSSSYKFGGSRKEENRCRNKKTRLKYKRNGNLEMVMEKSFAVVKKSENPMEDFRESMLEMIMEKQMFDVKDLEQLLLCFLCLNPKQYHQVIVEAFSEIWEIMFL